jgi:hypothetical protein
MWYFWFDAVSHVQGFSLLFLKATFGGDRPLVPPFRLF